MTTISKLDNKKYYVCIAKTDHPIDNGITTFCAGCRYQVRSAEPGECEDYEKYCIVNGTFDNAHDAMEYDKIGINKYNGTYMLHFKVRKADCKRALIYLI